MILITVNFTLRDAAAVWFIVAKRERRFGASNNSLLIDLFLSFSSFFFLFIYSPRKERKNASATEKDRHTEFDSGNMKNLLLTLLNRIYFHHCPRPEALGIFHGIFIRRKNLSLEPKQYRVEIELQNAENDCQG